MTTKTLLVHVGSPKTGTTTLQGTAFQTLPHVAYFGKFVMGAGKRRTHPAGMKDFRDAINYAGNAQIAKAAPDLRGALRTLVVGADHALAVASEEGFTNPFADRYLPQPKDIYDKADHLAQILMPLRDDGIDVKILLTMRPQRQLLPSLFSQVYLQGFASGLWDKTYESFLDFVLEDRFQGQAHAFEYDRLIGHYQGLFGQDAVTAVTMAGIYATIPGPDVAALAQALHVDAATLSEVLQSQKANVRQGPKGHKNARMMMVSSPAAVRYKAATGFDPLASAFGLADRVRIWRNKPVYRQFNPQEARIADVYAASNRALKEQFAIDLDPATSGQDAS